MSVKHSTSIEWYKNVWENGIIYQRRKTKREKKKGITTTHAECKGKGDASHLLHSPAIAWQYQIRKWIRRRRRRKKNKISTWMRTQTHTHTQDKHMEPQQIHTSWSYRVERNSSWGYQPIKSKPRHNELTLDGFVVCCRSFFLFFFSSLLLFILCCCCCLTSGFIPIVWVCLSLSLYFQCLFVQMDFSIRSGHKSSSRGAIARFYTAKLLAFYNR